MKNPKGSLLTLISGDRVHLSPHQKVIKQTLFSELLEAKELIQRIQIESKQYRLNIAKECEGYKEQAEREGFKQGFEQWLTKIRELEERIEQIKSELEQVMTPLALTAAKKIVGREIELDKEIIVDIVKSHLKAVKQSKRITISVSKEDYFQLDQRKNELKENFEALETFSVRPRDDLSKGSCIIETESGIINATIENQWALIEKVFAKIDKGTSK
jgi:type III secretion protein L